MEIRRLSRVERATTMRLDIGLTLQDEFMYAGLGEQCTPCEAFPKPPRSVVKPSTPGHSGWNNASASQLAWISWSMALHASS